MNVHFKIRSEKRLSYNILFFSDLLRQWGVYFEKRDIHNRSLDVYCYSL